MIDHTAGLHDVAEINNVCCHWNYLLMYWKFQIMLMQHSVKIYDWLFNHGVLFGATLTQVNWKLIGIYQVIQRKRTDFQKTAIHYFSFYSIET